MNISTRIKRSNAANSLRKQISRIKAVIEMISFSFQCSISNDPIYIQGDPRQLGKCFLNFNKNAFEACKDQDSIKISARTENNVAYVVIQDSGMGMSQEVKESIFTPFFTTKETRTGIGAYIAKTIIEKHGGCVEVESECGNGTTITIYLPSSSGFLT